MGLKPPVTQSLINDGASALRCLRALAALCAADKSDARVPAELWDADKSGYASVSEFFSGENERRLARQQAHEKMLEALGASKNAAGATVVPISRAERERQRAQAMKDAHNLWNSDQSPVARVLTAHDLQQLEAAANNDSSKA